MFCLRRPRRNRTFPLDSIGLFVSSSSIDIFIERICQAFDMDASNQMPQIDCIESFNWLKKREEKKTNKRTLYHLPINTKLTYPKWRRHFICSFFFNSLSSVIDQCVQSAVTILVNWLRLSGISKVS